MTPPSPERERLPRLSRRALVLGSAGVLVAAAVMATLGFTAGHVPATTGSRLAAPPSGVTTSQLTTLSLSEVRGHKPLP